MLFDYFHFHMLTETVTSSRVSTSDVTEVHDECEQLELEFLEAWRNFRKSVLDFLRESDLMLGQKITSIQSAVNSAFQKVLRMSVGHVNASSDVSPDLENASSVLVESAVKFGLKPRMILKDIGELLDSAQGMWRDRDPQVSFAA